MDQLSERLSRLSPEQLAELIQRVRGPQGAGAPASFIPRRAGAVPYPLSFAQRRLWFVQQLDPAGTAYNMVGAVRLDGALDTAALRRALDAIVQRHHALRTTIAVRDGEAVQVIAERMPAPLEIEDLQALPAEERDAAALLRARREHARGFDLEAGPLLRATLLRLAPERHVLLLAMHHLISDGWSRGIIVREIAELYTAFVAGQQARLAELPVRYADYAVWQRERLQGDLLERELGWWKQTLAGAPEALELPADHARPPVQSFAGGTHRFTLPDGAVEALRGLARQEGATLFMALLAAFKTLLLRYTGQADLVLGTPVANRGRSETAGVVGFFANTLALRTDLGGDPTFRQALRRVRDAAAGAYAHEELPFERLVEALHPRRDLSRNPVFQVMFLLDESPLRPFRLPRLELAPVEVDSGTSMFDLTLGIETADDGARARLEYAAELFDAGTVERMAEHFGVLLRGIAADPDARISALPLAAPGERARLAEWNATERAYPADHFVHQLFTAQAARTPGAEALVFHGERTTYTELDARANRLANHLRALGVRPETRVGVCMQRTPDLIVALLAVLKAGGAYVPLDPAYPPARLRGMIEDAHIALVLTTGDAADRLPEDAARLVRIDQGRAEIDAQSGEAPRVDLHPDHLSHVIFTSGSTGRPKGVMIRHGSTAVLMHWMRETVADEERACMLASTSVSFDVSVAEIFGTLCWGGTLVLVENALHLPSLADSGVRSLCTVPSAAAELLRSGGIPASVRSLNLAGEALPAELARRLYALGTVEVVRNLYGPTEDTSYSTCAVIPPDAERARIGRAMANTRAYVLDAALRSAPVGVAGELYLAGDGLARGYEGRPGLTAECFLPDPHGPAGARMYRTRDRARWTADGGLEYLGRVDLQVKVRGVRMEPGEIEAALRAYPAVAEAVAVVRDDGVGERRLVAYFVAADGAEAPSAVVLRAHLRERLPEAMVPSVFVPMDALPRTGSGKLDRGALPAPDAPADDAPAAPRTPAEELLAGIYAQVLGVERVGADADFFETGGHSLLAMRLTARVRDAFGVALPVRALFETPTVAGLAARIEDARRTDADAPPPLVPVPRSGPVPASLAQRRLWFLHQLEPGSAAYNLAGALRIRGPLDARALERGLAEAVRRHEPLRTRFAQVDGEPVQVIDAAAGVHLPIIDLTDRNEAEREDALRALAADEALRPFDLAAGPLVRCTLVRAAEDDHALLVTMHHVIADGWSIGVLVGEVSEVYAAVLAGRAPALPPLPVQYADHAAWQRAWLAAGEMERQTAFWRQALAGAPPLLELPTDWPRPLVADDRGAQLPFALSPRTAGALRALARREGATLFMTLLAAWQLLLSRYSGQDDVAVGTPIAGRGRTETERLIGFFVNTLVLRTDLSGDPSFRALLGRVRETALAAYAHQDVPFEALVEALRPERSRAHTPLFQAAFSLQPQPPAPRLGEAQVEPMDPGAHAARFDLSLALAEEGDAVQGSLTYRTALWDRATAERMLSHFAVLLDEIVADAARPVSAFGLMGDAERRRVLEEWNATDAEVGRTRCIHHLFAEQARRTPDAQAVVCGAESLTFAELEGRANRFAHHLRGLGVGPDARVGMCLERGVEMIAALLGILKAGGAYLPLDPAHAAERLLGVLADAGARVVITTGDAAGRVAGFGGAIVRLDADAARIAAQSDEAPLIDVAPENLAYVIYTSGSTGRPKGVMVEHRSVLNLLAALERGVYAHRGGAAPRVSVNGPVTFDTSVKQIIQLLRGATLCIIPDAARYDADALGAVLRAQAVEVLDCTPAQLRTLMADGVLHKAGPALTDLLVAGEAIDHALWAELAALPGRRAWNLYGPTECTVDTALCRVEGEHPVLGGPVANARLYVLAPGGAPAPIGVPGELYVGGAGVARGYLGRPALTAERFVPDPFSATPGARLYRTGDRVRWKCVSAEVRERGSEPHAPFGDRTYALTHSRTHALEYLGRTDFQLKIRGVRMEPGEIEAALQSHPAVRRAIVVAREDGAGERRLVGYVVAPADAAGELRAHLAARLPKYMVPSAIVALDALPLTANGKVDRRALPAPDFGGDAQAYVAPRKPAEETLAGIFAQVLGVERVGAHDDYFALGGHSLLATRLVSRVREAMGVELPLRALFEAPTPALLAARVDAARGEDGCPQAPLVAVRRDGPLPLSFAQRRLWFIDQLQPGNAAYNLPYAVRLRGRLDANALRRALAEVVGRHESLRTRFPSVDGEPVQVIDPAGPIPLALADLSAQADPEAGLRALCADEAARPFDLAAGPLLRCTLARVGDDDHALLLTLHHAVSDGWSTGVLVREVSALYTAFAAGDASPLAPLPLQYADYAAWQRERLAGEALEAQLAWWHQTLHGAPPLLEIPTDRPRPPVPTGEGGTVRFTLPAETVDALWALARGEGATLFMALLAGWQLLLSHWSGQDDVCVGTPVAGRTRGETEGLIGLFVNTLVLRGDLSGAPGFRALLRRVREAALGAFQHQDLSFERLVEELAPARALGHTPLFQAMFILQNNAREALRLGGLDAEVLESVEAPPKFDLTLAVMESDGGLDAELSYRADLFDAATAERMARHFGALLAAVAADPDAPATSLPFLGDAERRQLAAWNDTDRGYPRGQRVHDLFEAQAIRTPDAPALVHRGETLSYAELDARANRLANHLRRLGAGVEMRVGVCLERTPELIVSLLAVLKAGGAYVPLDPAYPRERLGYMVQDADVRLVLTTAALADRLPAGAEPVRIDASRARIDAEPADAPRTAVHPENLSHVIFTSGSTGRPKGVMIRHASTVVLLHWLRENVTDDERAAVLGSTSINFDVSVAEIFGTLCWGGTLVLVENALELPAFASTGIRYASMVPTAAAELLRAGGIPRSVRTLNLGGEPLPNDLAQALYALGTVDKVGNLYGPTEDTTYSTYSVVPRGGARVMVGRPVANTRAYVLDDGLRPVPVGVIGELYLAGDGLSRGYAARPALTAERFVPDPFGAAGTRMYRVMDRVRWTADGELEYFGRTDFQVKLRGFRIELGEIETALRAHPMVHDAVAVVREDAPGDRRLAAYVVAGAEAPPVAELRAWVSERLPAHMLPSAFVALDALPRTPNGKIDRLALPAPEAGADAETYGAPRTPAEEIVAGIFAEVLGAERVGAGDDFFALGGHSLLATRVASRVREAFGAELPLRALFEAPTVQALAARIDGARREDGAPPLAPLPRDGGGLPLSFAQQRLWFIHQMDPGSSAYLIPAALRLWGKLDVAALERALTELVRRHETLRTTFRADGGAPMAIVAPPAPFALTRTDLRALPRDAREAEARRLAADEATRPFDLTGQPPVRAHLVRIGEADWQLSFTLHHVAGDGWSLGVLVREVSALYGAFCHGEPSPLPELPVQYADYAAWQRGWLTGQVLETQLAWWRDALAGAPPLLELPTDHPRPLAQGSAGGQAAFRLPAETTAALREIARREGATLFMVLLAAWQALLARYAGTDDVSVGTPVAGRTRVETEGLIGFFVNTLVIRTDLSGDPAFRELVARVRETALNAYGHQDIPFERLVEELAPERSLRHTPLFQVMLVLQNNVREDLRLGPIEAEPVEAVSGAALFDLMLNLAEDGDALAGTLDYRAELFERATVRWMLDHFGTLLRAVAADPAVRLSAVDLLDAEERAWLAAWNDTHLPLPDERRVHRIIEAQARRTPDAVAVICGGETLTYAELDARANRLARHLAALGAGPEVRVGICLERSAGMVVAMLAVLKSGAAYLPLDPSYPADRLAYMLEDSGAPLLVTEDALRGLLTADRVRIVSVDADADAIAAHPADAPRTAVDAQNAAYVIYTSGSTGRPKGVQVTHANASAFFAGMDDRVGPATQRPGSATGPLFPIPYSLFPEFPEFPDPPGTWLAVTRISFDIHVLELLWTLARGFKVVVQPEPDRAAEGERIAEQIRRHGVTHLQCTPSLASMLIAESGVESLAGLERLFLGGEALPRELAAQIRAVLPDGLVNLYGPTETTVWSATHAVESADGPIPIGRPIANTRVYVVDAALRPQPGVIPGELCIAGAGVTRGYLGRPALTAERFVPDPFAKVPGARMYRTGDRVRWKCVSAEVRECGSEPHAAFDDATDALTHSRTHALEFLGRIDQQVKIRGHRIEPGEIEAVLRAHPAVSAAVVHVRQDTPGDAQLVAYVVPAGAPEAADDAAALREGQVRQWGTVWDDTYAAMPEDGDATFDIAGWNSSYTGEPIPAEEMREWVDATVARILALGPGRVMELGVGTGLLLHRVAPRAASYLGTDLSPRALRKIEERVRGADGLPPVTLMRREAADFSGMPARAFDTAVLNSVCQYFPGPDYLAGVVDGVMERLADGGAFFVGDVRHRGTLAAFRTAVEFDSAPDAMTMTELRRRAVRAAEAEEELVAEPDFFHTLARRNPRIGRVEVRVKRGVHHNELTRHRYDVVLRAGPAAPRTPARALAWDADGVTMERLGEMVAEAGGEALAVMGVPDARVARELRLVELAADADGPATVGDARRRLEADPPAGIDPETIWMLAEARGMAAELRPAAPGRFDVLFHALGSAEFDFPPRALPARPAAAYTNDPLRAAQARELPRRLRAWLRDRLPGYMVPAAVVPLDAFPLTPNGKLDRRALPAPPGAEAAAAEHVAPRTATEEIVAGIIADVLRVERVGARDDFFALGGHSLLATQVATRVRAALGTELPLSALFQAPTAAGIAAWLDARRGGGERDAAPIERVATPGVWLPLSFAQRRLWLVHQMDTESRVYNQGLAFRLRGQLDAEALRRAMEELVRRHAVFRTRFVDRDGVPGQVIDPPAELPLPLVDLSGAADREEVLRGMVRDQARRLFDLASGTLLRVLLVRLADDDHALVGTMHHITNDGWSASILFGEVAELYHAFAQGRPSPLAEPVLQYADYAAWQRAWLTAEREAAQLDYWRRRLDGLPALHLATDRTRAADGTDGDTHPFALSAEVSEGVRRLSRALGATPFMTLLAAFQVLLHWQGQGDEVVVGTDVANRNLRAETEGMVGFFVNQLVLRTSLAGNPDFRALVARVREETLAAYDHQDVPFDRVVEALQPRRAAGATPFFRVKFVLQNAPVAAVATLPGLTLERIPAERGAAQLDVLLSLHDDGERLAGHWEYRTSLFSSELIARWTQRFAAVLEAAVADPGQGLDALRARLDADEVRGGQDAQEAMRERRRARFARPAAR